MDDVNLIIIFMQTDSLGASFPPGMRRLGENVANIGVKFLENEGHLALVNSAYIRERLD